MDFIAQNLLGAELLKKHKHQRHLKDSLPTRNVYLIIMGVKMYFQLGRYGAATVEYKWIILLRKSLQELTRTFCSEA